MRRSAISREGRRLVGFEVGSVAYGIDIDRVRAIVRPLPLQPLPHMPEMVAGVADHRGVLIPVLDLRRRFGLVAAAPDRAARWIIVTRERRLVALIVDRASEVLTVDEGQARGIPELGSGAEDRAIAGAYNHRGRIVFVSDIDRVTEIADRLTLPTGQPASAIEAVGEGERDGAG
ncbi:MAG: chemotaxis protein CheW [Myxococcales bacterium]|nr:chemotaxis protein CheW [Myxococcales bacterium]